MASRLSRLMGFVVSSLVVSGIGAAPAVAGDVAELSCPVEALSTDDAAMMVGVIAYRNGDVDAARSKAAQVVATCGERFGWSEDEADAAYEFLAAALPQAHHRRLLVEGGVDAAWLEREVIADGALVAASVTMREDPPEFGAFAARVLSRLAERHRNDPAITYAVGAFVFNTAFAEAARRRFSS